MSASRGEAAVALWCLADGWRGDVGVNGVIAPFMYLMLAIGVDLVPEQLMWRVVLCATRGKNARF